MRIRPTRRRYLLATGTVTISAVAGCTGSSGTGDGNDGGDGAEPSISSETTNNVDGIEIVDTSVEPGADPERFVVTVTVENTGQRRTVPFEFGYNMRVYDADGNDITGDSVATVGGRTEIGPGEQIELEVQATVTAEPDAVARYELSVRCATFTESDYCA